MTNKTTHNTDSSSKILGAVPRTLALLMMVCTVSLFIQGRYGYRRAVHGVKTQWAFNQMVEAIQKC